MVGLGASNDPGLNVDGDRGVTGPYKVGVNARDVSDGHGIAERHCVNSNGCCSSLCNASRENSPSDLHLPKQPPSENISALIGVTGIPRVRMESKPRGSPAGLPLRTYVSFRYGHKGCSQLTLSG